MGKDLQQVALDIISSRNDIDKAVAQLLNMDQLFLKLPFEKKVKMIRLILKDRIVPNEKTFQNATREVTKIMFEKKICDNEKINEKLEVQIRSKYDEESEYFYNELMKETDPKAIKASSMFWDKFSQITVLLKEMAYLVNFQLADE